MERCNTASTVKRLVVSVTYNSSVSHHWWHISVDLFELSSKDCGESAPTIIYKMKEKFMKRSLSTNGPLENFVEQRQR